MKRISNITLLSILMVVVFTATNVIGQNYILTDKNSQKEKNNPVLAAKYDLNNEQEKQNKNKLVDFDITIMDDDEHKVYFQGDYFEVEIVIPEESLPSIVDPEDLEGQVPGLQQAVFVDKETHEEQTVIVSPDISPVENLTLTISGNIGNVNMPGVIGFQFTYMGFPFGGFFPVICSDLYNEEDDTDFGKAIVGVGIPAGDITTEPAFEDIDNMYDTDVTFIKENEGSIAFENLNIADNRNDLINLQNGMNIIADSDDGIFYIEIDPDNIVFLSEENALVTLEGVDFDEFVIYVTDFGEDVGPDSSEDDTANNSASYSDEIVTFEVDGFSRYTVLDADRVNVEDVKNIQLSIFPNPASKVVYIKSDENIENIKLLNISGQTLKNISPDGFEYSLNVDGINTGIYFIKVKTKAGMTVERIQIIR